MIKSRYRFHGHASLKYVYRNAKSLRSGLVVMKYVPNSRRKNPRIAVVVSKKVHKSAVGRNRIRRRMYEILRTEIPKLGIYDMVFIVVSAEVRSVEHQVLAEIVYKLLDEAGIYKNR
jgi:ribonuclease P protein component